jgi:hypothetical protein
MKILHHTIACVYLAFALLATGVSYTLEAMVVASLLALPFLAKLLVLVLEGAKVGLIFFGHIGHFFENRFRFFHSAFAFALRFLLIGISVFASLFLLSTSLYLPHEQAAREHDREQARIAYEEETTEIRHAAAGQAAVVREGFRQRQQALQSEIDRHTADIRREVDNPVNGVVVGVRYRAFERNRDNAKAMLDASLAEVNALLTSIATDRTSRLTNARRRYDTELKRIAAADYESDARAHNPLLWNFTATVSTIADHPVSRVWAIFLFSLLIAIALEGAIVHFTKQGAAFVAPQLNAYRQYLRDLLGAFTATSAGLAHESTRFRRIADSIRVKTREAFRDFDRMMRPLFANTPAFRKRSSQQSGAVHAGSRPPNITESRFGSRPRKPALPTEDTEENTHA